jgi:hypothetical protein
MTREQIEALDGHTEGPWEWQHEEECLVGPSQIVMRQDNEGRKVFAEYGDGTERANARLIAAAPALRTTCLALMDEVERLTSDRPFILGANHGYDEAMGQVAAEARRYASHYPDGSDGRNTFIIFAEWADRAALQEQKP